MMRRLVFCALLAASLVGPASAESLISTLSDESVEITSSFTGEQIVVFGAIGGVLDPDAEYEVAVVVQGPDQDVVVRRKERLLGIWANRAARTFTTVPSYYVMHLSEDFSAADPARMSEYRLGVASLPFVQEAGAEGTSKLFAQAAVDLKVAHGLYAERMKAVEFLDQNVFRTTFFLPSEIPTGTYSVRVYLFREAALLAGQTQTLFVGKGGFSERIAQSADDYPLAYGLACVFLAIFTGWFAGVIFRRP